MATVANAINSKVSEAALWSPAVGAVVTRTCQVYPVRLGVLGVHGTFWSYSVLGVVMAVYGAVTIPDNRSDSFRD